MLWTGQRGGDARVMGPQNIRSKRLVVTQEKTRATVSLPILPALASSIMATKSGALVFILSEHGKTYSRKGFGNKFRQWGEQGGLNRCSAHGHKKEAGRRFTDTGGTKQKKQDRTAVNTKSKGPN